MSTNTLKLTKPILNNIVKNLKWLKTHDLYKSDVKIDSLKYPLVRISGEEYIIFCSNNYLGLSERDEVKQSAIEAILKYGNSTSESRKLGGNLIILEELEDTISSFKQTEDTMIFATGLLANVGIISAISDIEYYMNLFYKKEQSQKHTVIFGDAHNHRSLQMGIKLSKALFVKYEHNNVRDLETKLNKYKDKNLFIITDGVFSMDGDTAPLNQIVQVANEYKAAIMIDDAHGTGVFGKTGRGVSEHFNISDQIDFNMGTLSKAFGGLGGFVSAKKDLIDMLKINTSTYYFTSSLPADQAASLTTAIKIVQNEPQLRKVLWKNVFRVLKGLERIGVNFPLRFSPIIPIIVYDEKKAYELEEFLFNNGIICSAVTVPAVAPGMARIRLSINTNHTQKQINSLLELIDSAVTRFNLPLNRCSSQTVNVFLESVPTYIKEFIKE